MPLYAIILDKPDEGTWTNVRAKWPKNFVLDNRLAFISADDVLTFEIARDAGIGAEGASGIVIQMDFFSGRTNASLVEWVSKNSG